MFSSQINEKRQLIKFYLATVLIQMHHYDSQILLGYTQVECPEKSRKMFVNYTIPTAIEEKSIITGCVIFLL